MESKSYAAQIKPMYGKKTLRISLLYLVKSSVYITILPLI